MKVISLNVSGLKEVPYEGKLVQTGIFKKPVEGSLEVKGINFEGDDQGNRKAHGGPDRVVYSYAMEHYDYWKRQYPNKILSFGMFGENLTTKGMFEDNVHVGDIFRIGTAELMAVQPRMPCYRLGIKFDDQKIIDKYIDTDYCGIFYKLVKEGKIQSNDEIQLLTKEPDSMTIVDIYHLMQEKGDQETIKRALNLEYLPAVLKIRFQKLLGAKNNEES